MSRFILRRAPGGMLAPVDQAGVDAIARLRPGEGMAAMRLLNVRQHRKLMVLLNFAFDQWEGDALEYQGQKVEKNRRRFRQDVTIQAGHFDQVFDGEGGFRLVARSLNFEAMEDQDEFSELYEAMVRVILARVLTNYRRDDLDRVLDDLVRNFG